jgi:hypothetical protein
MAKPKLLGSVSVLYIDATTTMRVNLELELTLSNRQLARVLELNGKDHTDKPLHLAGVAGGGVTLRPSGPRFLGYDPRTDATLKSYIV